MLSITTSKGVVAKQIDHEEKLAKHAFHEEKVAKQNYLEGGGC